jgi:hypothetical protein
LTKEVRGTEDIKEFSKMLIEPFRPIDEAEWMSRP